MDNSMNSTKKRGLRRIFFLCPRRHVLLLFSILGILLYYLIRNNNPLVNAFCNSFVYPYHRTASKISGIFPFSVMELIYTSIGVFAIAAIVRCCILIVKRNDRFTLVYRTIISLACVGVSVFSAYSLLWSTTYYADSFSKKSGISASLVSVEELSAVTSYFINLANEYAPQIKLDANGVFDELEDELFNMSVSLYDNAVAKFNILNGPSIKPKKMIYSLLMSNMNFTGVFFPITGEANLNTHSPKAFLPVTLAHEIAHQRGVAAEDEANFVAVFACLESNEPIFIYSASLLAYTYLGNALHNADYETWETLYYNISEPVRADLRENNEYWDRFNTKTAKVSEAVYSGFLMSNGQELGMKSYGACVDLLVEYYFEIAQQTLA